MFIYPVLVATNYNQPAHFIDEIILEKKPLVVNEFADGNSQRIFTAKFTVPRILRLRYEKLNDSKTKEFSNFWDNVKGTSNFWYFNPKYYLYIGKWQFLDTPIIEPVVHNSIQGVYNISVQVRKIGF